MKRKLSLDSNKQLINKFFVKKDQNKGQADLNFQEPFEE